jgi:ornithine cyclodeaminase/alanine dehydrogenase-like protein (mu-crystallin family)
MTLLLSARDVAELLTLDDCIAAVEDGFRAHGEGRLAKSGILSAHAESGAFHIKTASYRNFFAAKTNANFPGNRAAFDLPTIQGLLLLFDATNGVPLAVMDSGEITVRRTAAATAVAAKYLARPDSRVLEVYGCGRQSRVQVEAIARVFAIDRVIAHDIDEAAVRRFAEHFTLASDGVPDIIVTCTTSKTPFLSSAPRGAFIAAVGADNPGKSEVDPILMRASTIVTDLTEQAIGHGDLHHAPDALVHAELGEIVAGKKRGRASSDEIIVFDSTGVGFQDAAAAAIVYERAVESGRGTKIDFA